MAQQVPFNEYEAVLLLDAYLKVRSGELSRTSAIQKCSDELRRMAVHSGLEIDDSYRRPEGIRGRMACMEAAYQGKDDASSSTRLFSEVVSTYRNDNARYQQMLEKAQRMAALPAACAGESASSDSTERLDFNNLRAIAYSKPLSLSYFGETRLESSWISLYVDACKLLLADYPKVFSRLSGENIANVQNAFNVRRPWLVDAKHLDMLAVAKKVSDDFYVEGNQSAIGLIKHLRFLLQQCGVADENVIVIYTRKSESGTSPRLAEGYPAAFYHWLKGDERLAENTCRSYVSAVLGAERFAESHALAAKKLYTDDIGEAKATADALFANPEFLSENALQHNRFRAAIAKLLCYIESRSETPGEMEAAPASFDVASCVALLEKHFPRGYRLGSPLDRKRLFRYFEESACIAPSKDASEIESALKTRGVVCDGKLYMPQTMLSPECKERLFRFIDRCFAEGRSAVYYDALFQEFSDDFLDQQIHNAEMLKAYLSYFSAGKYRMERSYLSPKGQAAADPFDEIRQCMKAHGGPMSIDALCRTLPHLPTERIRTILSANREFVRNRKGEYFHVDVLDLTPEELENIASLMNASIDERSFLSGNELFDAIRAKYPSVWEKNAAFSAIGWRDALKYRLDSRFSFSGNIISRANSALTMSDVFADYARSRHSFTIDELEQFAGSIGTTIYFDALYAHAIRINRRDFVPKADVHFSVERTDAVLEQLCQGDYLPLCSITEFVAFPEASFPWTDYLLEQYVAFFSEKFQLLHAGYGKSCAAGAIVRRDCRFEDFDELATDVLARSDVVLQKKEALDFLAENRYIARRAYANIEALLIRARAQRNQKETH